MNRMQRLCLRHVLLVVVIAAQLLNSGCLFFPFAPAASGGTGESSPIGGLVGAIGSGSFKSIAGEVTNNILSGAVGTGIGMLFNLIFPPGPDPTLEKLDEISGKLDEMSEKLDVILAEIKALDRRLDEVEKRIVGLIGAAITDLKADSRFVDLDEDYHTIEGQFQNEFLVYCKQMDVDELQALQNPTEWQKVRLWLDDIIDARAYDFKGLVTHIGETLCDPLLGLITDHLIQKGAAAADVLESYNYLEQKFLKYARVQAKAYTLLINAMTFNVEDMSADVADSEFAGPGLITNPEDYLEYVFRPLIEKEIEAFLAATERLVVASTHPGWAPSDFADLDAIAKVFARADFIASELGMAVGSSSYPFGLVLRTIGQWAHPSVHKTAFQAGQPMTITQGDIDRMEAYPAAGGEYCVWYPGFWLRDPAYKDLDLEIQDEWLDAVCHFGFESAVYVTKAVDSNVSYMDVYYVLDPFSRGDRTCLSEASIGEYYTGGSLEPTTDEEAPVSYGSLLLPIYTHPWASYHGIWIAGTDNRASAAPAPKAIATVAMADVLSAPPVLSLYYGIEIDVAERGTWTIAVGPPPLAEIAGLYFYVDRERLHGRSSDDTGIIANIGYTADMLCAGGPFVMQLLRGTTGSVTGSKEDSHSFFQLSSSGCSEIDSLKQTETTSSSIKMGWLAPHGSPLTLYFKLRNSNYYCDHGIRQTLNNIQSGTGDVGACVHWVIDAIQFSRPS